MVDDGPVEECDGFCVGSFELVGAEDSGDDLEEALLDLCDGGAEDVEAELRLEAFDGGFAFVAECDKVVDGAFSFEVIDEGGILGGNLGSGGLFVEGRDGGDVFGKGDVCDCVGTCVEERFALSGEVEFVAFGALAKEAGGVAEVGNDAID